MELDCQVAVVGSGVAGALVSDALARRGLSIVVLEAGPRVERRQAAELLGQGRHPYPAGDDAPSLDASLSRRYYAANGPDPFEGTYERVVGGTTWHWLGSCLRLLPSDFEMRTRYGVGVDWPIRYGDLEPFYGRAERELGVSGDSLEPHGSPRSQGYPMPATAMTYLDRTLQAAVRARGYAVHPFPAARNSLPYDGRPACCGNGTCVPLCPVGAKYDASVHVARAERAGARVLPDWPVTRLVSDGSRICALEGPRGRVRAEVVVLAANALESPRLLLASGLAWDPVGRHLMAMNGQISRALAPRPVWPFRSPLVVSGLTQFREGAFRAHRAAFVTAIGNDGWPDGTPPELARRFIAEGLKGKALRAAVNDHASRQLLLVSSCEELPDAENRLTLDPSARDSGGLPRPRIHYRVGAYTRAGIDEAVLVHARIFEAAGATDVHHIEESSDPAHIAGTCRMGTDPRTSVVDSHGRCHHHPNLFLVGSAVFPTAGTAPPTLTIAALALRTADAVFNQKSG